MRITRYFYSSLFVSSSCTQYLNQLRLQLQPIHPSIHLSHHQGWIQSWHIYNCSNRIHQTSPQTWHHSHQFLLRTRYLEFVNPLKRQLCSSHKFFRWTWMEKRNLDQSSFRMSKLLLGTRHQVRYWPGRTGRFVNSLVVTYWMAWRLEGLIYFGRNWKARYCKLNNISWRHSLRQVG